MPTHRLASDADRRLIADRIKRAAMLVLFVFVFVGASYLAHAHKAQLARIVQTGGVVGIGGFILLTSGFVVFVIPLDIVFLIPVGVAVWGPIPTAFMSITGWTLGAAAAFGIARTFGVGVVRKIVGLENVRAVERRVPKHHLFGAVIFLRALVSVDLLSYALGLFSTMPWGQYVLATAIGVAPLGFYFAYAGTLPFWYQLAAVAAVFALAAFAFVKYGAQRAP